MEPTAAKLNDKGTKTPRNRTAFMYLPPLYTGTGHPPNNTAQGGLPEVSVKVMRSPQEKVYHFFE
jgi:hypothetical protein